jgi:hypothetical protein
MSGLFNQSKGGIQVPVVTVAQLTALGVPAVTDGFTPVVMVSDAATNATLAFSDGTNWKRADTGATVS